MNPDIPRIRHARLGEADGTLTIDWMDGGHDFIDFAGLIASDSLFAPLTDRVLFAKVEVIDWGAAVSWGDSMELSGSTLARMAEAQRPMAAPDLVAFQKAKGISNRELANLIERSLSIVKDYKAGRQPIPLTVATSLRAMHDPIIFAAHYHPAAAAGRPTGKAQAVR